MYLFVLLFISQIPLRLKLIKTDIKRVHDSKQHKVQSHVRILYDILQIYTRFGFLIIYLTNILQA